MDETNDLGGGGVLDDVIVDVLCLFVSTGEMARPLIKEGFVAGGCDGMGGVATVGISSRSPRLASLAHAEARIF